MRSLLFYIRAFLEIISVTIHALSGLFLLPFPYKIRIFFGKRILRSWSWSSCKIFNIKVHVVGEKPKVRGGTLAIANHMSYWDIFVLGSLFPTVFLAKIEVRKMPILGLGAWAVGCLFVDRSSARSGAKSIRDIAKGLVQGATVITFPEGATSNVEILREFKVGIFQAAVLDDIPIQSIGFTYTKFATEGWGSEPLWEHIKMTGKMWSHHTYLCFGDVIKAKGEDPRKVRERAQVAVQIAYDNARKARDNAEQEK